MPGLRNLGFAITVTLLAGLGWNLAGCAKADDDDISAGSDDDATAQGDDDDASPADDARIVVSGFPETLECSGAGSAMVTVENTGTSTWLASDVVRLGAVDDDDPLYDQGVRVDMDEGSVVAPGETFRFDFPLVGADQAGTYVTDWQMVREGVRWFGEIASDEVAVTCGGDDDDDDATEPPCVSGAFPGPHTNIPGNPQFDFEIPAATGVEYSTFHVEFDATPWWGDLQCYNTYYHPPQLIPIYHRMATLQYGHHWCQAGNLFNVNMQGPDRNRVNVWVWNVDPSDYGNGCQDYDLVTILDGGSMSMPGGDLVHVEIDLDMPALTMTMRIGSDTYTAALLADQPLEASASHPLVFVLSFDQEPGVHCADENGVEDPANEQCCWPPSYDWMYEDIAYELCE